MPERAYLSKIRKWAGNALGLTSNQYYRVERMMRSDGRLNPTMDRANNNANYVTLSEAHALIVTLQAHEDATPPVMPLPDYIEAAMAAPLPTPPTPQPEDTPPPVQAAEAPTMESLAGKTGPAADPSLAPKQAPPPAAPDPADATTSTAVPTPKKTKPRVSPRWIFAAIAVAGLGITAVSVIRARTRKRQEPPRVDERAAPQTPTTRGDFSPDDLVRNLQEQGFAA